jgi:UDP:flavonoid glycosyltransferase YjiC (YdhE family)
LEALEILHERNHTLTYISPTKLQNVVSSHPYINTCDLGEPIPVAKMKAGFNAMVKGDKFEFTFISLFIELAKTTFEGEAGGYDRCFEKEHFDLVLCDFLTVACMDSAVKNGIRMGVLGALGVYGLAQEWYIPPTMGTTSQPKWVGSILPRLEHIWDMVKMLPRIIPLNNQMVKQKKALGYPGKDIQYYMKHHFVLAHSFLGFLPPRPIPSNVITVGPLLPSHYPPLKADLKSQLDLWQAQAMSVVYVAFGSAFNPDMVNSTENIMKSFDILLSKSPQIAILWAMVNSTADTSYLTTKYQTRFQIRPWVEQQAVLLHPTVKVFMSHGGQSSAHESLFAGKPMLLMPFSADQSFNANSAVEIGVALMVHKIRFGVTELADKLSILVASSTPNLLNVSSLLPQTHFPHAQKWFDSIPQNLHKFVILSKSNSQCHLLLTANTIESIAEVGYDHLISMDTRLSLLGRNQMNVFVSVVGLVTFGLVCKFLGWIRGTKKAKKVKTE